MTNRFVRIAVLLSALAPALPALAATNVTPAEIAVLPPYCDAKIGSQNPAAVELWLRQLKRENWDHMHHYCGGLVDLNRYYGGNAAQRKDSLRRAMWEFNYSLQHTQPDFYLRADMHYNRGKVWRLQGNDGQALADFQRAIELSPGMPSATLELADIYKKLGKRQQALAALTQSLERFPDHKGLHRRYLELGGDPAQLATLQKPADIAPAATKAADTSAPGEAAQAEAAQSATEADAEKIGNATNPWCRFCPDPAAPEGGKQ